MTAQEQYNLLQTQITELQEKCQQLGGQVLREGLESVFQAFPEVESIGWQQYTPYFNDGDPCTFSVCCDEPNINDHCGYDIPYDDKTKSLEAAQRAASSVLNQIAADDYLMMFGDHAEITIRRNGEVDVAEYDHD